MKHLKFSRHGFKAGLLGLACLSSQCGVFAAPSSAPSPAASVSHPHETARFVIQAGQPEQAQLQQWGRRAGWALLWNLPQQWIPVSGADFGTDFRAAVAGFVQTLASNGADIQVDFYELNRVAVIHPGGADR